MSDSIFRFLSWLENLVLAESIRGSLWLYPALEIVHLVGIVLLVGAAFMFDLRLLGLSKNLPPVHLSRHLLPWSQRGLLLIIPSGILLFITHAWTACRHITGQRYKVVREVLAVAPLSYLLFGLMLFPDPQ